VIAAAAASERLSPRTSQTVFRVLLDTLARPGRVLGLPDPRPGPGIVPLALAVVGSPVAVLNDPAWQERICRATGASATPAADASLVAVYGTPDAQTVSRLRRGSALAPEDGAKVGLACRRLAAGGPGELTLRLAGPGVPGAVTLGVDGIGPAVFDALREANAQFPAGVDVWLVDDRGRVAGLPRSARVAVI
jgi:alpha-D-ribose 1-methylphosphonate 5-triphosphate synthase subunit PhnH